MTASTIIFSHLLNNTQKLKGIYTAPSLLPFIFNNLITSLGSFALSGGEGLFGDMLRHTCTGQIHVGDGAG